jgi:diacylglycerol kinase family enzyme
VKIFFILNPSRIRRLTALREAAALAAHRHGHSARFGAIDRRQPHSMEDLLNQAHEEGCERVVAAGGDGTFNRMIRVLGRQNRLAQTEIGLVPAGTCNDFLRSLRLTARRTAEALRVVCTGKPRETDLGELNGELFLNNAGFGRRLAPTVGRRRVGALRSLRQFVPTPLRAHWENGSAEGVFFMGLVCNAPFFSGGLHFSRQVPSNDGLLDVYLVPRMAKAKLAAMILLGRLGRPLRVRQLVTLRLNQFEIESGRDLWPQLDGEPPSARPVRRLNFRISASKALIVRAQ